MSLFTLNRNLFKTAILVILCIFLLNLTTFNNTDAAELNGDSNFGTSDTLVNLPSPLHYIWQRSTIAFLPEEETITLSIINSMKQYIQYTPTFLSNDLNTIAFSLFKYKLSTLICLSSFNKSKNTTSPNSIPLGGHAPPRFT